VGVLYLTVRIGQRDLRLELRGATKIVLGRSEDCDIVLESRSVSKKHLEVSWDGRKVSVRDLKSTHGTKTFVEKAPFEKKVFPPSPTELSLLLADVPLVLAWGLQGFDEEHTAFVDEDEGATRLLERTMLEGLPSKSKEEASLKTKSTLKQADSGVERSKIEAKLNKEKQPESEEKQSEQKVETHFVGVSSLGSLLLSLLFSFFILNFWSRSSLAPILEADAELLKLGGALDYFLLFVLILKTRWYYFLLVVLGAFFLNYKLSFEGLEKRLGDWRFKIKSIWSKPLGMLLILSALFYPVMRVARYQHSLEKYDSITALIELEKENLGGESKSRAYYDIATKLQGSSYLYLRLLNLRFARIYTECAKEKNQSWEQKRMCLVLFLAASIESFDEVKPALLAEVSLRLSLLLSLDGLIRIIRVEGLGSEAVTFFTNALDATGLSSEKAKINALIYSPQATKDQVLVDLISMRRKLDQRIVNRQKELNYPAELQLKPFNPLNVGL